MSLHVGASEEGRRFPCSMTLTVLVGQLVFSSLVEADRIGTDTFRAGAFQLYEELQHRQRSRTASAPSVSNARTVKQEPLQSKAQPEAARGSTLVQLAGHARAKIRDRGQEQQTRQQQQQLSPASKAPALAIQSAAAAKQGRGMPPTGVFFGPPGGVADEIGRPYPVDSNDTRQRMWQNMMTQEYYLAKHQASLTWKQYGIEVLLGIGGGTGATVGGTGDPSLDQDMVRRMRYQDKAVMLFLLMAYVGSLIFSANLAYRQASNTSPVTYYADPRYHNMVIDSNELDQFLETFNQPPKDVYLQVTGFVPLQDPELMSGNVDWYGQHYHVAFSFALDLSPWVVRGGIGDQGGYSEDTPNELGVNREDLEDLRNFLASNSNDLATVELHKEVEWHDWEELAMNIKHQIRQCGFGGIVSVHRNESETVCVYKNKTWANFMHSRTTKVLWALSLLGWMFYQPYMWLRVTALRVQSSYRIEIPISQYWPFIEDKIGADGFNDQGNRRT